jgi:hypothetical protein
MAVSIACYCSREDVKRALDQRETARNNAQVDRAIQAAVPAINGLLHRVFQPVQATRYFDWPNTQTSRSWRLWLDRNELISVSALSSGGTTITSADYFLEPNWGPPYNRIEIDLASSAAFASADTHQRQISITGLWAGQDGATTTAGTLAEALDASETGVDVSDSTLMGVGDVIIVDSERMIVTGKTMLDTAVNSTGALTASASDVTISMSTTTAAPVADETILIDSERMLVVDVAGTTLTVKRAWDGTVLATHSINADIYAPRTLTVVRGAQGTTAATHTTSTAITRQLIPPFVNQLAIAEAINDLLQEMAGYSRGTDPRGTKSSSAEALADVRKRALAANGRKARTRAV